MASRAQLAELGVTGEMVRSELVAGRWERTGRNSVAVATFPGTRLGPSRVALAHSSPTVALDGVTALEIADLTGFTEQNLHLSGPPGSRIRHFRFVTAHYLRGWRAEDVLDEDGLRRVEPSTAAVRAAFWLSSPRAAATVLAMTVQQRLAPAVALASAAGRLPHHARRIGVEQIVDDLAKGAQALGELDFAELCRRYGLPEPTRQAMKRRGQGSVYRDVHWQDYGVTVEIDGSRHFLAQNHVEDLLRHNTIALGGDILLRIPLMGLRLQPGEFMQRVAQALQSRGWRG